MTMKRSRSNAKIFSKAETEIVLEPNLTPQEKCLRKSVWEFHGKSERIDSGKLAAVPNGERSPVWAEGERLRQAARKHPLLETLPMLVGPENKRRRANIRNGREGQILHDREILKAMLNLR
jgi:hypothetical protein